MCVDTLELIYASSIILCYMYQTAPLASKCLNANVGCCLMEANGYKVSFC